MPFIFLSMDVLSNFPKSFYPQISWETTFIFMSLCLLLPLYKALPLEKDAISFCIRRRSLSLLHWSFAISSQLGISRQICNLNWILRDICSHKLFDLFHSKKNTSSFKKFKPTVHSEDKRHKLMPPSYFWQHKNNFELLQKNLMYKQCYTCG